MSEAMESYPHLSKAPIVEAVIDFRLKLPSDFKLEVFYPLRVQLAEDYPGFEEQQIIEQTIKQEPGQGPEVSTRLSGIHGHRLLSKDGKNVVQLRRDGFTFSRLNPYTQWEEVFREAWRVWGMYEVTAVPLEVSRIAVRYINRLLLPVPLSNPEEYLKAPPMTAEGWPRDMSAFLSRVVMHDPESEIMVNVIQALEPQAPGQSNVTLLFDIDAYEDVSLPADDVTIKGRFDELREMKNRVFFKGLTQKAIDLFR
ncbi:TIGR04255 family protein [soil metagenome]